MPASCDIRKARKQDAREIAKLVPGSVRRVITIEMSWSDRPDDELISTDNRRYSPLAMMLRARYLVDVDCWSEVRGQPLKPDTVHRVLLDKLMQDGRSP